MNWIPLKEDSQLDEIIVRSEERPLLIFKHSTRCSISLMVKSRLDKSNLSDKMDCYYLDLLNYRSISNRIASDYKVVHESPQALLIQKGRCVYYEIQHAIYADDINEKTSL